MLLNKRKNIILIALYEKYSFAINSLHFVLEKAGFNVTSIFFKSRSLNKTCNIYTSRDIRTLVDFIKIFRPFLVGLSVNSTNFKLASKITSRIKKNLNTFVIWGGIHPSLCPSQCIKISDAVCLGEGEKSIVDLAKRLSENKNFYHVPNIWVKKGKRIIRNNLRPLIKNLDDFSYTFLSCKGKYFLENAHIFPLDLSDIEVYYIMTSRGCFFNCSYCSNEPLRKRYKFDKKFVRRRSVSNVIQELIFAKRNFKKLKYIVFYDDIFTFDIEWLRDFGKNYSKKINLPFICNCHPQMINDEMIRILKHSGLSKVYLGIQSGSEKIRKKYFNRSESNQEILSLAWKLHRYGIHLECSIIFENPFETDREKEETFNLLLKFPRPFRLHSYNLAYFPGTKITKILLDKGLVSFSNLEDQNPKGYMRWSPVLDLKRNKNDLFWENLYFLSSKKYIPQTLLVFLAKRKFLKKNPVLLTRLLRLFNCEILTVNYSSKVSKLRFLLISLLINSIAFIKTCYNNLYKTIDKST